MSQLMLPSLFASGGTDASVPLKVHPIDLTVIIAYMLGIVALGCWAGLRKKATAKGSDYFLAGKSLKWPMIGLALFATNISTIHLVSLAESGYCSGLLYGNFEWMAGFTLVILSLFFAPFYIRAGVATLPDFIEKRYNRSCRDILAVLCIFSAVVVHIGFSLYTGAMVLEGSLLGAFMDHPEQYRIWTIVAICGATALYTIIGGLMAVVLTESIQTVVLIIGAVCITLLGLYKMGGWDGTFAGLLTTSQVPEGWRSLKESVHPVNFSMSRPDSDPTGLSWYAVFTGYWITGIWYWCTDQTIVQRVLGAKDENHARIGPLFAAFIKILPVFIFVLPGLICLGMIHKGIIPHLPLTEQGTPEAGKTYSHMITHVLPVGAQGIVIAALLAALMSTVSGALNSIATLVSYDIYKRWAPDTSDRKLITVGRIATFAAMLVAIAWSLVVGLLGKTIFQAMVDVFCAVAPPTTVIFVWGVFWRRASATAALITLIVGVTVGGVVSVITLMNMNYIGDMEINSLLSCFLLAVFESVVMIVCSLIWPHQHTEESEKLVWKSPLDALRGEHGRGLHDYRIWAVGVLVVMIGLYWYWWGDDSYYPVQGTITLADGTPVVGAEVHFECKEAKALNFTDVTDGNGGYTYASKQRAGGAPEGTRYLVRIVPKMDLIVQMKEVPEENEAANEKDGVKVAETETVKKMVFDKVLYEVPTGTEITEETLFEQEDAGNGWKREVHKDVYTFTLSEEDYQGNVSERVVHVPRGENVMILRASDIPEKYRSFDSSSLTLEVNKVPIFTKTRKDYFEGYDFKLE
ncbi:MAG TPA: sodium:solute symporter [Thermoguttaceae bacterium]|nr:sodium:solute symporter [Thermoguttaceae bacterium]